MMAAKYSSPGEYQLPKRNKGKPKYPDEESFATSFSDESNDGFEGHNNSTIKEPCKVCGDEVSGFHYGVRTCEGCKAFFRRTIQKNKSYTCRGEKNCPVERMGKARTQRCCYCRFQECVKAGMKIDAVRQDRARGCPSNSGFYTRGRSRSQMASDQEAEEEPEPKPKAKRARQSYAGSTSAKQAAPAKATRKSRTAPVESPSTSSNDQNDTEQNSLPVSALQPRIPRLVSQMKSTVQSEVDWKESFQAVFEEEVKKKATAGALEMICRILDNKVYAFVEWARDSSFFDSLDYEDQKKLLQFGWNSYLMFDFVYHLSTKAVAEVRKLPSGAVLKTLELAALGHTTNASLIQAVIDNVREMHMNRADYLNVKMILLLNPFVPGLVKQRPIKWAYDKCQEELKVDSASAHPDMPNRFNRFMTLVTEMRKFADEGEQFLYNKARSDGFLDDTLLLEMIEMKRES